MDETRDPATQAIFAYRIPNREQFNFQTGNALMNPLGKLVGDYTVDDYVWNSFLLACASVWGMKNYSGNHLLTHYYDTAVEFGFRHDTSHAYLEQLEMAPSFLHDVPEDVGSKMPKEMRYSPLSKFYIWFSESEDRLNDGAYSLPAAYILVDIIDDLLSEKAKINLKEVLSLLTNWGDLLFDPVRSYFEKNAPRGRKLEVNVGQLAERMDRYYGDIHLSNGLIRDFYNGVIAKWEYFVTQVLPERGDNLQGEYYESIRSITNDFISLTRQRVKRREILDAGQLEAKIEEEYTKARSLITGPLEEIRPEFMGSLDSKTIMDARKTLYRPYIKRMMDKVVSDAEKYHGHTSLPYEDFYLLPAMVKLSDSRDVVTRLGPNMQHIRSMFRKVRILLEEAFETVSYLKNKGHHYQRLESAANFLLESLNYSLKVKMEAVAKEQMIQTQHTRQLKELQQMWVLMYRFRATLDMPSYA